MIIAYTYELLKIVGWDPCTRENREISIETSPSFDHIKEVKNELEKALPYGSKISFRIKIHTQESSPYGDWRDTY